MHNSDILLIEIVMTKRILINNEQNNNKHFITGKGLQWYDVIYHYIGVGLWHTLKK